MDDRRHRPFLDLARAPRNVGSGGGGRSGGKASTTGTKTKTKQSFPRSQKGTSNPARATKRSKKTR